MVTGVRCFPHKAVDSSCAQTLFLKRGSAANGRRSRAIHSLKPRIEYLKTTAELQALDDHVSDAMWDEAVSWVLDNPAASTRFATIGAARRCLACECALHGT
jgi:hypothetical protein